MTEKNKTEASVDNCNVSDNPQQDTAVAVDPFDPEAIRLEDVAEFAVKKEVTTVRCSKPNKHAFVRTHPDAAYTVDVALFDDQVDGNTYLVHPEVRGRLAGEVTAARLFTAIDRQGNIFLWPVKLGANSWNESALKAAVLAQKQWVRVKANLTAGMYDTFVAGNDALSDPEWPPLSLQQLLKLCFGDRLIDTWDHPVLQRLRGEA